MAREIHCACCNKYLGSITKARLIKEIAYLCIKCENDRYLNQSTDSSLFDDLFGKLTKGRLP